MWVDVGGCGWMWVDVGGGGWMWVWARVGDGVYSVSTLSGIKSSGLVATKNRAQHATQVT